MRVEKRDGSVERRVLTGMVTSTPVLGRISSRWDGKLFSSEWANLIGGWCVNYHAKTGKAPNRNVVSLFEQWAESNQDDSTHQLVGTFLESLSDEYARKGEGANVEHLVDLAGRHFDKVRIQQLREQLEADVSMGRIDTAVSRVNQFCSVQLSDSSYVEPINDDGFIDQTLAIDMEEDLITYEGDLGRFFAGQLRRGAFVACMASEKVGKSMTLMDVAVRALERRRKVGYFECGDMTRQQVGTRFLCKLSRHPTRSPTGSWPYTIKIPTKIRKVNGDEFAQVEYEEKTFDAPLNAKKAKKQCALFRNHRLRSDDPYFRLSCHPNGTLSVSAMSSLLDTWKSDGFSPDVIVCDYADILMPPKGVKEARDQVNANWAALRALSQRTHCLVVTATQANAASYEAKTLGKHHFSNDKRKYAHVTALFGINVLMTEKERGVSRYNWIVVREGPYNSRRCVHVAGCLAIGAPALVSTF